MAGRGEGGEHGLHDEFACAVRDGRYAGEGVECIGEALQGDERWWLRGT